MIPPATEDPLPAVHLSSNGVAALSHADAGRPVFPCKPDNKKPRTPHGFKDATTDAASIRNWWTRWPDALIGMPTGAASGCFVLDVDVDQASGKDGEASLSVLTRGHGPLPDTIETLTPRGGRHLFFRHPGTHVPCSASKLGPDLDIRGDGGYVIVPPSALPDGRSYQWEGSSDPDEGAIMAEAPPWLLALVTRQGPGEPTAPTRPSVAAIPEGTRNATLTALAGSLRRGGMDEGAIGAALLAENAARCCPPLPGAEVLVIAKSVSRYPPRNAPAEASEGDDLAWPKPQPLTAKVAPEPYPLDALPEIVREAVEEVAGFVQAPLPLVAGSALAALSLACQGHLDVQRAEKLQGPVGLFLLSIADSGERKTTCDGFFASAMRQWEAGQAEAAKPELERFKADLDAWNAERDGLLSAIKSASAKGKDAGKLKSDLAKHQDDKPDPPRVPRLMLGDETPENLAWSLAKKWPSAGVLSSEAGLIFGSHGMGKDSVLRNLALLNILWDGGTHSVGRRTSESFTVRGARLTLGLQVQETALRGFFERTGTLARGTGFLARFLIAWPESTQGQRPFREPPANWPYLARFHARVAEVLRTPVPVDEDGGLSPALLTLAPETKAAWILYHDAIEAELADGGELREVRDVASKSSDNAVRLAALFHLFEGGIGPVGLDAFEGASRIAAWHLSESRRFFGELALPAELADAARLDTWLLDYCRRERTCKVGRSVAMQYGPIRVASRLDAAIKELVELDRARVAQEGRRRMIEVNPALVGVAP